MFVTCAFVYRQYYWSVGSGAFHKFSRKRGVLNPFDKIVQQRGDLPKDGANIRNICTCTYKTKRLQIYP